ncbi:MAG: M23 family metallopeptidase [Oscillospiraceae bacterium]|nr:M23 family metallopeptidase [Oscillospiraceae bacterium]
MEQKKSPGQRLGEFFSEKGFYIVLLLSTAVIATSVWLMFGEETKVEEPLTAEAAAMKPALPKEKVTVTIAPVPPEVEQKLDAEPAAESAEAVWSEEEEDESLPLYFIWPVSGVLERGHSQDTLLYDRTMADWRTHDGWDIQANLGGHVLAVADGSVSAIYQDDLYGTTVEIDHGSGLVSCYANLAAEPTVAVGDVVQVGDVIGAVGESALCEIGEVYHLHFAMKLNGQSADPANWLPER